MCSTNRAFSQAACQRQRITYASLPTRWRIRPLLGGAAPSMGRAAAQLLPLLADQPVRLLDLETDRRYPVAHLLVRAQEPQDDDLDRQHDHAGLITPVQRLPDTIKHPLSAEEPKFVSPARAAANRSRSTRSRSTSPPENPVLARARQRARQRFIGSGGLLEDEGEMKQAARLELLNIRHVTD
jgi:hypothetical protein